MITRVRLILGSGCLLAATLACGSGLGGGQAATIEALSASIDQTATAAAGSNISAGAALLTAEAEATAISQGIEATQTAQVGQNADTLSITATAVAPILAELPTYGVNPSEGAPGWLHPPVTLAIEGSFQTDYDNQFIATVVHDFVVSADITWNTTGFAGCGFVLRSDGNDEAFNQYLVIATRTGSGTLTFITQQQGAFFYRDGITASLMDPTFRSENDTTNRLTVVGRGDTFTMYTNGARITEVTAREFEKGFVAMVALSQYGSTVCQFNNAWLWLLN